MIGFSRSVFSGIVPAIFLTAGLFILAAALPGCEKALPVETVQVDGNTEDDGQEDGDGEKVTVRFNLSGDYFFSDTKSGVGQVRLLIYCDGALTVDLLCEGGSAEFELMLGKDYSYYAVSGVSLPTRYPETFLKMIRSNVFPQGVPEGIPVEQPMAANGTFTAEHDGMNIEIKLRRLYAKVEFSADLSDIPGLEVTSACIKQAATSVRLFYESAAVATADGGTATEAEIEVLNSGGKVTFYVPENRQGVLLPDNSDSWAKVPENIPEKSGLCTYIEVTATFSEDDKLKGDIVYRFYLGNDVTSDFNVTRNTLNTVRLIASKEAITRPSWKIDGGDVYAEVPFIYVNYVGKVLYKTREESDVVQHEDICWNDIMNADGTYITVGHHDLETGIEGAVGTSRNGRIWNISYIESGSLRKIEYGNGRFVALDGTSSAYVSDDASNWRAADIGFRCLDIAYGNGLFTAVGYEGGIATSADGEEWEVVRTQGSTRNVVYGDGEFLVVTSNYTYKSTDGTEWTEYANIGNFSNIYDIIYGNGIYVLNEDGNIYTSPDGINWTDSENSGKFHKGTFDFKDGIFIQVYSDTGIRVATSLDGINWTIIDRNVSIHNVYGICIMEQE